ncbi:hypothetical protein NEUTE1DRAFT_109965 [Neurospora tetrasperma FGSC 2508]|uniref:Uncharacterized protein n=2 Tax=Neurospora TaxID=5140 RepID=A0AAJ0IA03_9PEZI|nr:uncharacterized protein NEUTE1DRAFT_109965 [Neurospora tetrasperma FGSC 2508]EGO57773.1 hypothetical protein NEUTE1DRAFT_109965 [Neurospora tetrasperma FGSC 2508]EGZ71956.1 hypothetical protein NEUTE2DRAFT_129326 [Neurospora tetrasperma FGSC 2509]KAK3494679.1 hypothetical protein B0T23DRAFT_114909 [Neurospora hispaniola]
MASFSPEDPFFNLFFTPAPTSSARNARNGGSSVTRSRSPSPFPPLPPTSTATPSLVRALMYSTSIPMSIMPSSKETLISKSPILSALRSPVGTASGHHRSSISSTTSSVVTTSTTSDAAVVEVRVTTKPAEEATIEELLARPPPKHSLSYYVKNARDRRMPVVDPEEERMRFEKAKAELLAAKAAFDLKI